MGKARGEGSRYFVIYSDPLKPLDSRGWPIEQAFDALLKQCGYAADWEVTQSAVLRLRHAEGPNKGIPVGVLSPVDHPRAFNAEIMRGNNGEEMARQNIMVQVLRTGLNGWRGDTRDGFSIKHGLAEQRRRYPERFPPDDQ
jgi:hypothetical protein